MEEWYGSYTGMGQLLQLETQEVVEFRKCTLLTIFFNFYEKEALKEVREKVKME